MKPISFDLVTYWLTKKHDIRTCLDVMFFCYLCGLKTHRKNIVLAKRSAGVKPVRYSF